MTTPPLEYNYDQMLEGDLVTIEELDQLEALQDVRSHHYQTFLTDLLETDLILTIPEQPFRQNENYLQKIKKTYGVLRRSSSLRKRHFALYYAYCLGSLIEDIDITGDQRSKVKKIVSPYFYAISCRTFRLFERNPKQIFRTKKTSLKTIYKLPQPEYHLLCAENVLDGASN